MIQVTDTLYRMVMAAPLTVAASSALSADTGAQRDDMHDNTRMVSSETQEHVGRQWRLPDRLTASGQLVPASAEWYGARHGSTLRDHGIAGLGVTPSIHIVGDRRTRWYVEDAGAPALLTPNAAWSRGAAAYGGGAYAEVRYVTRSGVGLELRQAAGYRHPDNAVSSIASHTDEAIWTWTEKS